MTEIFRNLLRRKARSVLTISGIVIGIFALTTMGAMAEHFNSMLDVGVRYSATSIGVGPPNQQHGSLLPLTRRTRSPTSAGWRLCTRATSWQPNLATR